MSRSKHTMTLRSSKRPSLGVDIAAASLATTVDVSGPEIPRTAHAVITVAAVGDATGQNMAATTSSPTALAAVQIDVVSSDPQEVALTTSAKSDTSSESDSNSDYDSDENMPANERSAANDTPNNNSSKAPRRTAIYLSQREKVLSGVFMSNSLLHNQNVVIAKTAHDIGWSYWQTLEFFTSLVQKLDVNNTYVKPVPPNTPQTLRFEKMLASSQAAGLKRVRSEEVVGEQQSKRSRIDQAPRSSSSGDILTSTVDRFAPASVNSEPDESHALVSEEPHLESCHPITDPCFGRTSDREEEKDNGGERQMRTKIWVQEQEQRCSQQSVPRDGNAGSAEGVPGTTKRPLLEEEEDKHEDDYDFNHSCLLQ